VTPPVPGIPAAGLHESVSGRPARDTTTILGLPGLVWVIAGTVLGLLVLVSSQYGFHRDEMYFVVAGRHPDWGYVDQPPFTPLLSAIEAGVFGLTPTAVRLGPAVAAAIGVLLTAAIARQFGGTRSAQVLAALVIAVSGWLGAGHLDETATYDILFWTVVGWLLVPLLGSSDSPRTGLGRWIALGAVIGIALENKTLAISLAATIGASLILLRRWDVLRQPGPWLAAAIAFLLWLPNLIWQAEHGFPQLAMAQAIAADQGPGIEGRLKSIVELVALAGPFTFPVAIVGVIWLLRSPDARPWRPLGLAVLLQLGLMIVLNGKSYYSAGFLPLAFAAGSLPLDRWLGRGRVALRRATFAVAAGMSATAVTLILLPIVPVGSLHATPIPGIYQESAAQVGWPELAAQVEAVVGTLPPAARANAAIVTANYGQYSALTLLGSGLPAVYSGHNSTWDWGQPPDGSGPIVLVDFGPYSIDTFADCSIAVTIDNGYDLPTQEQGHTIWVCSAPREPWSILWPSMRHIN
jgi:4-amino-4-deoxy-L-arabinose transferase-like glycosyltransferase